MKTITVDNGIWREEATMISDVLKGDSGLMSRLRGYKSNTTLTSLNLSGSKTEVRKKGMS